MSLWKKGSRRAAMRCKTNCACLVFLSFFSFFGICVHFNIIISFVAKCYNRISVFFVGVFLLYATTKDQNTHWERLAHNGRIPLMHELGRKCRFHRLMRNPIHTSDTTTQKKHTLTPIDNKELHNSRLIHSESDSPPKQNRIAFSPSVLKWISLS